MAPAGSSSEANTREYASMIQASCVWVACVARAISGSATFSDDIAATTVASARHTTAVTAPGRVDGVRVRAWFRAWVWAWAWAWAWAWVRRPEPAAAGDGREVRVVVVIVSSLTFRFMI